MTKSITEISHPEFFALVLGIIASRSENPEYCWFKDDPSKLHPAIFDIYKRYSKFFPPLKKFHFCEIGAFPYSSELALIMDLMFQSGMIWRKNPYDGNFARTWSEDSRKNIEEKLGKLFSENEELRGTFDKLIEDLEVKLKVED